MNKVMYAFKNFQCNVSWLSDLGSREEQQDSYYINHNADSLLAVVCDGMGGLSNGQAASTIVTLKIGELFKKKLIDESFPDFFTASSDILDEAVNSYNKQFENGFRSGTTIVAAAIHNKDLYWFSCGDSRMYIIRNGEIAQITQDHNYQTQLDNLFAQGELTEKQYINESSRGEALISYIGMGGIDYIDINSKPFKLLNNDIIILVSDGLYKALNNNTILNVVCSNLDVVSISEELSKKARELSHGVQDNTTIIVIKYQEVADETDKMHA